MLSLLFECHVTLTSRNTRRPVTVIASDICHMTVEAVSTAHVGAQLGSE